MSAPGTIQPQVVEIVGVFEGVGFYPACGNEPLLHDGTWWYPIVRSPHDPIDEHLQDRIDEALAAEREPSPVVGAQGFARVAPPGPGDDLGTLVVWDDGVARWVADSGTLDVWMIDEEITYNWVC